MSASRHPDLHLGVRELDVEHALQAALVDAIEQAVRQGGGAQAIESLFAQFVDYTTMHFLAEQALMRLHGYPLHEAHEQEHDDLLEQVRELRESLRGGDVTLSLETLEHIRSWHVLHVRGMDRTLADFLLLHGLEAASPAPAPPRAS